MTKDLVVARYMEDTSWVHRQELSDWNVLVYQKSVDGRAGLDNIGREAGTYLHHILENYHRLADETVFCQGNPFAHTPDFLAKLDAGNIWLGPVTACTPEGLPHADWVKMPAYCQILGLEVPDEFVFVAGAQYRVTSGQVTSRSKGFYTTLQAICLHEPTAPWTIERLWPVIWDLPAP